VSFGGWSLRELRSKKAPEAGERIVHGFKAGSFVFLEESEVEAAAVVRPRRGRRRRSAMALGGCGSFMMGAWWYSWISIGIVVVLHFCHFLSDLLLWTACLNLRWSGVGVAMLVCSYARMLVSRISYLRIIF
jgi:hypothetical protein